MVEFGPNEGDIRQSYVGLHESTGESYDSIARRAADNVNDPVTAAKIRALGHPHPSPTTASENGMPAPTAADHATVVDSPGADRQAAPHGRRSRRQATAAGDGSGSNPASTAAAPTPEAGSDPTPVVVDPDTAGSSTPAGGSA